MADRSTGATPNPDHASHDPELIVALLDDDAGDADRASGTALIEMCPECARLHADLLALASSTQAMPAPARTRDFRLTAADAARLSGEPLAAATRLGSEMTDPRTASAHASHDTMLVASLADHSIGSADRTAAERLIADCSLCAALHGDLLAIRTATIQLPTPPRQRDYQLTEADAARLRRSGWRRWVAALGSPRDAFTRPLAVGLTTLGIIGILVGNAPLLSFGSASSGSAEQVPAAAPPAAGGAAEAAPTRPAAAASDTSSEIEITRGEASGAPVPAIGSSGGANALPAPALTPGPASLSPGYFADQGRAAADAAAGAAKASPVAGLTNQVAPDAAQGSAPIDSTAGTSPLIVLSSILLIAGLGLFLLRWMARRVGA